LATIGEVGGYGIDVVGKDGEDSPETRYQRTLRGESSAGPEDLLVWSGIVVKLSPGKSDKNAMIVNKFYNLSRPGKYKIQVQRTDPTSKAVVKSNIITVTATP
jgi:hypothetical protein